MDNIQEQLTAKLRGWHAESSNWPCEDSPASGRQGGVMAKTCRTCRCRVVLTRCPWLDIHPAHTDAHKVYGCYQPRETPLLVDALAVAAKLLLEKMDNIGDGMLFNLDLLDARDTLKAALARYKEEVGDVEVS